MDCQVEEEQRLVPNKQNRMKMKKKNMRSKSMSNPSDNTYAGLMNRPCYPFYNNQQNQLPPLLPLPSQKSRSMMFPAPVVCTSSFRSGNGFGTGMMDSASWVFNLSPPPSSLPLPKFLCQNIKAQLRSRN